MIAPGFGDGWMSKNAADLVRIVVGFGGFDIADIMRELPAGNGETLNTRSIESALARIRQRQGTGA